MFHAPGTEGGSGGGFNEDVGASGAGGANDRIGKNSGGMKLPHTS